MRWKLLRRRLSISAPRVIVRSHLPWPIRWAVLALAFGFSASIALWAFEFGRDIAGLDRDAREEVQVLRDEVHRLRAERDKAQAIANTVESLLKTEQAAQNKLAQQLRQAEADTLTLRADLGFFERLLPAQGDGLALRAVQVEPQSPGQMHYQMLLMQSGKAPAEFRGKYAMRLVGTLDGRPWSWSPPDAKPLTVKQYARLEGIVEHPAKAVVESVEIKVSDNNGSVRATQTVKL
jgi:hypothetical protein